jgi:hypothetical protein
LDQTFYICRPTFDSNSIKKISCTQHLSNQCSNKVRNEHSAYFHSLHGRELFDAGQIKLLVPREKGEKQDDKTDEATNYTPVDLTSTSNTLEHDLTTIVYPDEDLVYINGKLLTTGVNFKRVYIAFHKPGNNASS